MDIQKEIEKKIQDETKKEQKVFSLNSIKLDKTPRPAQIKLLDFTKQCVMSNKKYMIIDAPVGIGKSYFSVMFMDWFKHNYDMTAQFDILTNSKILQEQYTNDFDFMNSLWGKGSYQCDTYDTDCATGSEWCRIQNKQCDSCPYAEAKWKFDMGDVSLTNFHLFLTYMVYMPMAWKRRSRVLIIDEAHDFDSVFCDFITTKISKPLLKRNGFTDEETKNAISVFGKNPENLSPEEFVNIIKDDFLPIVKSVINRLASESEEGNIQAANFLQSLNNNFMKWDILYQEYNNLSDNWIVEIEKQKKYNKEGSLTDEYYEFTAQPVWAYPYLESKIWNKYDYVIFMSGTILDKKMYSDMNGFDVSMSDYISIDSPFPVENRPIYYFYNTGKQSFKTKELTWERQHPVLKKILKKHKNSKGIIHTANYEIQGWVEQKFNESRILTHASDNRNDVLQHHYNSDEPTVLVSPSMMTGVDLKDDYSRHQTILKVPYPNLGSKKIKKRMETNDKWYGWKTCADLIQMYGRSIRSAEDNADTYVLDSCFGDVLKWNGHYFPKWVKEAIHYIE